MSLLGGGGSSTTNTTTTVSPQDYITNMLESISSYAEGIDPGHYIQRQHVGFNPTQQSALSMMAQSSALSGLGNMLAPLADTGAGIYQGVDRVLESILGGGATITPDMLKNQASILQNSPTAANAAQSVSNTVGAAANTLGASPTASANASRSLASAKAGSQLQKEEGYQNMAKGLLTGDQKALTTGLKQAGGLGTTMIGEGKTGVKDLDEAIQNELRAGQLQQKETQQEYNTKWENQMGQELFPWEHADNMLNTLNKISRMAGYTTHSQRKTSMDGGGFFSPSNVVGRYAKALPFALALM